MRVWPAHRTLCALLLCLYAATAEAGTLETLLMPGPLASGHAKFEGECTRCHEPFSKEQQSRLCLGCHDKVAADLRQGRGFHGRNEGLMQGECKRCHVEHEGRGADIVGLDPETFDHGMTDFALRGRHARAECGACHAPGAKHREAPLACLGCHRDDDPHKGRLGRDCAACHEESGWRRVRFDHARASDFALSGKHAEVACSGCHLNERYADTPTRCAACHAPDDVHAGRYGEKCEACHRPDDWRRIAFDHDRDTRFRLQGAHAELGCSSCHGGDLYADKLPTQCVGCHRNDDEHKGRNGPKCEACHGLTTWSKATFDHGRDTKFPLENAHAKLTCAACHKAPVDEAPLERRCDACHRVDDVHAGGLGRKCETCHGTARWGGVAFPHDERTDFPLLGGHARLACRACHKPAEAAPAGLPSACRACHEADDVHEGAQGPRCERCHDERSWGAQVFFDHDLTRFPLIGLHAAVPCEECHLEPSFTDVATGCAACHGNDDWHEGRLGRACGDCHNPNGWAFWAFDHDRRTDFALEGRHEGLACRACHTKPAAAAGPLSSRCADCHLADDVHDGRFGRRCERCHVADSFEKLVLEP